MGILWMRRRIRVIIRGVKLTIRKCCHRTRIRRRINDGVSGSGGAALAASTPANEESPGIGTVALEENDVARVELFVFDESAPSFSQHIALTAVPVRVSEPPASPWLVFEAKKHPFLWRWRVSTRARGDDGIEREVFLSVLFGYDEAVEFTNVAWCERLLKEWLFLVVVGGGCLRCVGGVAVLPQESVVVVCRVMVDWHFFLGDRKRKRENRVEGKRWLGERERWLLVVLI